MRRFPLLQAAILTLAVLPFAAPIASAQQTEAATPASAPLFPPPNPANFTAAQPTRETVSAFLNASWGFDESRVWQVEAILKTQVEGLSKVVVFIGDKSGAQKPSSLSFYVLPGGGFLIAGDSLLPFGANPFAAARAELRARANGPAHGAREKDLELVEFADFQCPHCKTAQSNMERLAADFPKARIVFQNYPLTAIHPSAELAARHSICADKLGGEKAFQSFASAVFDQQNALATHDGALQALKSAALKAGLDAEKVSACADAPETARTLADSVKLAEDLNIDETPMLMINGRPTPANTPYETLRKLVAFQARLDGVTP